MIWLFSLCAMGATEWSGIDPTTVAVVGEPTWMAPEDGWVAPVLDDEGGTVRVFVADSVGEAESWAEDTIEGLGRDLAHVPLPAETAWGDMDRVVVFRDGNVAVHVHRPAGAAMDLGERLLDALGPASGEAAAPSITSDGFHVSVDGSWVAVSFRAPPRLDDTTMLPIPLRVIPTGSQAAVVHGDPTRIDATVWDRFGRSATVTWHASVDAPAP